VRRKRPYCPNCGGRSFDAYDPGEYMECHLCEAPTQERHTWYREKHPELYTKFFMDVLKERER
jgi:hypothetical protein